MNLNNFKVGLSFYCEQYWHGG